MNEFYLKSLWGRKGDTVGVEEKKEWKDDIQSM